MDGQRPLLTSKSSRQTRIAPNKKTSNQRRGRVQARQTPATALDWKSRTATAKSVSDGTAE
jgi:hypothetical protein